MGANTAESYEVLIAGGSVVGLSTALFLSWHGVSCLVVEQHSGTNPFLKVGGFNLRTMELFRAVDLESAIYNSMSKTPYQRSIAKVESLAGRELLSYEVGEPEVPLDLTPTHMGFIEQDQLELILRARAEEMGAATCFSTELMSFDQDSKGVSAFVQEKTTGSERTIYGKYLVAADGSKSFIRHRLSIPIYGEKIASQMNIYFHADLSGVLRGRQFEECRIENPRVRANFIHDEKRGYETLVVTYYPAKGETVEQFTEAYCIDLVRAAIGIPDLEVEIINLLPWEIASTVAERYQQGKVFLAGDSAHVFPPVGVLGANIGIQDAHNLAWKLALVIRGVAAPKILTTYEFERQPVAKMVAEQAILRLESNRRTITPTEQKKRLNELDMTFGYCYHSTAIIAEDSDALFTRHPFETAGMPGTRAPHVWLECDGQRLSTLDLFGRHFVLLTGKDGDVWAEVTRRLAGRLGLALDTYRIGKDIQDPGACWAASNGISENGAILVRPDGFIAYRSWARNEHSDFTLKNAIMTILCIKD